MDGSEWTQVSGDARHPQPRGESFRIAEAELLADPAGILFWPHERTLIVSDLHLEKGSSFATRGTLLPPYDTAATLARLAAVIARYAPRAVVALGDNFHDGGGPARLVNSDRAAIASLQQGRDWIWITGNHDPEPADGIGGCFADTLTLGPLVFRHRASARNPEGEIAGHLHPVARVSHRGRTVSRRCFVGDGRRAVMPAFGAYTGGLCIRHRAFAELFGSLSYTAHMLGSHQIYAIAAARCLAA